MINTPLGNRHTVYPETIQRGAFTSFAQPTSLMDVPGYVNPDKLMSVPIGFVCR